MTNWSISRLGSLALISMACLLCTGCVGVPLEGVFTVQKATPLKKVQGPVLLVYQTGEAESVLNRDFRDLLTGELSTRFKSNHIGCTILIVSGQALDTPEIVRREVQASKVTEVLDVFVKRCSTVRERGKSPFAEGISIQSLTLGFQWTSVLNGKVICRGEAAYGGGPDPKLVGNQLYDYFVREGLL